MNKFQVFDAASTKMESVKQAMSSMAEAKAAIKRVLETIEHGKNNELTAENPALQSADEVTLLVNNLSCFCLILVNRTS